MCFTKNISLVSFVIGITASTAIAARGKTWLAFNCYLVSFMQIAEYFMHKTPDNHHATMFAALLVSLQPLLNAIFHEFIMKGDVPPYKRVITGVYVITSIWFLYQNRKDRVTSSFSCDLKRYCRLKWGFMSKKFTIPILLYFLMTVTNPFVGEDYRFMAIAAMILTILIDKTFVGSLWCFLCNVCIPILALR